MRSVSALDRTVFRRGSPPRSRRDATCRAAPPQGEPSSITRRQLADGAAKLALSVGLTTAARSAAPTAAAELTLQAVTPPIAPAQPLSSRCASELCTPLHALLTQGSVFRFQTRRLPSVTLLTIKRATSGKRPSSMCLRATHTRLLTSSTSRCGCATTVYPDGMHAYKGLHASHIHLTLQCSIGAESAASSMLIRA